GVAPVVADRDAEQREAHGDDREAGASDQTRAEPQPHAQHENRGREARHRERDERQGRVKAVAALYDLEEQRNQERDARADCADREDSEQHGPFGRGAEQLGRDQRRTAALDTYSRTAEKRLEEQ